MPIAKTTRHTCIHTESLTSRHAWERDNAAVLSAYAELALSLERGACHRFGYVAGVWRWGKHSPRACARVRGRTLRVGR